MQEEMAKVVPTCMFEMEIHGPIKKLLKKKTGELFGWSVSVSGDVAIVGAPHNSNILGHSGIAYLYERKGSSWSPKDQLKPRDIKEMGQFGSSVAISGNNAVIGTINDSGNAISGDAYIYTQQQDGPWVFKSKRSSSSSNDSFGSSVAVSGSNAMVGAATDGQLGEAAGSTSIFQISGPGVCTDF